MAPQVDQRDTSGFPAMPGGLLPRAVVVLPGVLIVLLAMLALALLWSRPPAVAVDVGTAQDSAFVANFYNPEARPDEATGSPGEPRTYRWSSPGARLVLRGMGHTPALLRLHLNGDALAAAPEQRLRIRHDDTTLADIALQPGWQTYQFYLPASAVASAGFAPVSLDLVTPLVRPSAGDDRYLGFVLDWFSLEPLPPAHASMLAAVPWLRVGLVGWLLVLLLVLLLVVVPLARGLRSLATAPPDPPPGGVFAPGSLGRHRADWLYVYLPLLVGSLLLKLWAGCQPIAFAAALPLTPFWLAWASGGLVGLWLAGVALALIHQPPARLQRFWRTPTGKHRLLAVLAVGVLAHGLLLPGLPVVLRGTGALLVLALPGALLAWLVFANEPDPLERLFLGLCGSLLLPILLLLPLHALPGPLAWWLVLLACDAIGLLCGWRLWHLPPAAPALPTLAPVRLPHLFLLLLALAVGAGFRLIHLGSAEFQGDEVRPLLIATGMLYGKDEIILLRTKGPAESLLPAGPLLLTGQINEALARLPFTLAGVGVVFGCFVLARRLFQQPDTRDQTGAWVGVLAATLLALDGLLIGFARIVQYQSVVLLLALALLWCCWRFAQGADPPARYLLSAAVLAGGMLLAHYDGVFLLVAPAWLVLVGAWRRGWRWRQAVRYLLPPLLLTCGIVGSFYLPFFLHEWVSTNTTIYLLWRVRGQGEASFPYTNLQTYYDLATFYNTTFQMLAYSLLLLGGMLAWLLRWLHTRLLAGGMLVLLLVGVAGTVFAPATLYLPTGGSWAGLAFGGPLLALILNRATPAALRVLLLAFATPFLAMAFLIADPRTHFYAMHPAGALLLALALVRLLQWAGTRRARWGRVVHPTLAGVGVALLLLTLPYHTLLFLRQTPEYHRVFPEARPALYRASYGDERPRGGYFGFPHRDGWKVVGTLYQQGVLRGSYDSPEKQHRTTWYTGGAFFCDHYPDYIFRTALDDSFAPRGYNLLGYVLVDGQKKMEIYSGYPVPLYPQVFTLDSATIARFDARTVGNLPMQQLFPRALPRYPLAVRWQGSVTLHGYDYWQQTAPHSPPAAEVVNLYWEAERPLDSGYRLVADLVDGQGEVLAPAEPFCNPRRPEDWHGSGVQQTAFRIPADVGGDARLRVGLRHDASGEWLPLVDGSAQVMLALPK